MGITYVMIAICFASKRFDVRCCIVFVQQIYYDKIYKTDRKYDVY